MMKLVNFVPSYRSGFSSETFVQKLFQNKSWFPLAVCPEIGAFGTFSRDFVFLESIRHLEGDSTKDHYIQNFSVKGHTNLKDIDSPTLILAICKKVQHSPELESLALQLSLKFLDISTHSPTERHASRTANCTD